MVNSKNSRTCSWTYSAGETGVLLSHSSVQTTSEHYVPWGRFPCDPVEVGVGVFKIESRALVATLPRIRPGCFDDLVVDVANIRHGPITGNIVHPYINRRLEREPVRYTSVA